MTRCPGPDTVTVAGGGWVASGPPGRDRLQTPLRGPGRAELRIGDRGWFRHAEAGELCEHVHVLHTLSGDGSTGAVRTYRGEGQAFG